jgi:hypothetical protein
VRCLIAILALVTALLVGGCGSSSSTAAGSGARDAELSYFPADSPIVLVLDTDRNGKPWQGANDFLGRFPCCGRWQPSR